MQGCCLISVVSLLRISNPLPGQTHPSQLMSAMQEECVDNGPRRQRASQACVRCNMRKVRCDVTRTGVATGCTNCRLDDQPCAIRSRLRASRISTPASNMNAARTRNERAVKNSDGGSIGDNSQSVEEIGGTTDIRKSSHCLQMAKSTGHTLLVPARSSAATQSSSLQYDTISPGLEGHLVFSYFKFLQLNQLCSLSPDDATALEKGGCLHIPTTTTLDHLIKAYFLYVHPNLPIVDEGHFWSIYTNQEETRSKPSRISLFLFQAMLFAASNVCISSFSYPLA